MSDLLSPVILFILGVIVPLIAERRFKGLPERIWKWIELGSIMGVIYLIAMSDSFYPKVFGDKFSPIFSTSFVAISAAVVVAFAWWIFIVPKFAASREVKKAPDEPCIFIQSFKVDQIDDPTKLPVITMGFMNASSKAQKVAWSASVWVSMEQVQKVPDRKEAPEPPISNQFFAPPNSVGTGITTALGEDFRPRAEAIRTGKQFLYYHGAIVSKDATDMSDYKHKITFWMVYDPSSRSFLQAPFGNDNRMENTPDPQAEDAK